MCGSRIKRDIETKQELPLRVQMHHILQDHQEDHISLNAYPTQPKYIKEKLQSKV
jgi:hypothetical protein